MKRISNLLVLLCLCIVETDLTASTVVTDNPWQTIEEQSINGVSTKLKIKASPSLAEGDWISIEFDNNTKNTLLVEQAFYTINCKVYTKKGGKLLKSGRITSRSSADLLDRSLDSPFPSVGLLPGNNIASKYPSIIGAILLSVPNQAQVFVEATLELRIQISSEQNFVFKWDKIPFSFEWSRPKSAEFVELCKRLLLLLDHPVYASLHHYELHALLSIPEIAKGIPVETLLAALDKRSGKEDGRLAILYHLNDHFKGDKKLLDYYFELLKNRDLNALDELLAAPDIWDDRFLEPLIEQYQTANISIMHRVMDLLYLHQDAWIEKEGISAILSDLVLYQFETIIYKAPIDLTKRELFTASLLIDILGKTGNKEIIPVICPFLEEEERILDTGLVLDPNSLELPRPMRVCDNALEALMRLKGMDLIKAYKRKKYQPPYENGEAEIIISRIRDRLIRDFQKKGNVCR